MDPNDELPSPNSYSNPAYRGRTIAFYVLLAFLLVFSIGALVCSMLIRRGIKCPSQIFGGHNVEAADLESEYSPPTRSKTLNTIKTTTGRMAKVVKGKNMGTPAIANSSEEIELPRSARLYSGPGLSVRGAGEALKSSRIGQDAERKGVGSIQHRRRDSELKRQRRRLKIEAREPAPRNKGSEDLYNPYGRSVTLKEALAMNLEDKEMGRKVETDIGSEIEKRDFA